MGVEARPEKEKQKKEAEDAEKAAREQAELDAKAAREESKAAAFVPDKNKYKRSDEQKANCWNNISVIFTLKCTEASCKKRKYNKKTTTTTSHSQQITSYFLSLLLFYSIFGFYLDLSTSIWILKDFLRIFSRIFTD